MSQKTKQPKVEAELEIAVVEDGAEAELLKRQDSAESYVEEDNMTDDNFADESRDSLIEKLLAAQATIDEMKDGYVRAKADVENIQRRSQKEIISARKYAVEGFAQELLSVIDSLDQASKVEMDVTKDVAVDKMKEGLELTLKQLDKVMEKFGVCQIEAELGVKFDPDMHQAISMRPSEAVESGHIVDVMQKGFTLKDRLLRPAMVIIAT